MKKRHFLHTNSSLAAACAQILLVTAALPWILSQLPTGSPHPWTLQQKIIATFPRPSGLKRPESGSFSVSLVTWKTVYQISRNGTCMHMHTYPCLSLCLCVINKKWSKFIWVLSNGGLPYSKVNGKSTGQLHKPCRKKYTISKNGQYYTAYFPPHSFVWDWWRNKKPGGLSWFKATISPSLTCSWSRMPGPQLVPSDSSWGQSYYY